MLCSQSATEMSYFDYEKYNMSLSGKKEKPDENPEDVKKYLMGK